MEEIKAVLSEFKVGARPHERFRPARLIGNQLSNCDVMIREPNCTLDDLVDVIEGNRVYIPCIYVLNKVCAILALCAWGSLSGADRRNLNRGT